MVVNDIMKKRELLDRFAEILAELLNSGVAISVDDECLEYVDSCTGQHLGEFSWFVIPGTNMCLCESILSTDVFGGQENYIVK